MSERRLEDLEERILVLRDKAARENIDIPDEVVAYIADKYHTPQALKGALINVAAYAVRRRVPITLDVGRFVLDGVRIPLVVTDSPAEVETPEHVVPETLFDLSDTDEVFIEYEEPIELEDGIDPEEDTLSEEITGYPSDVYFVPMRTQRKKSMIERMGTALTRAGLESSIVPGDKVAIKVHFGEVGNTAFVSPIYVREVVRLVKELGGKPFLTDANTLYSGMRDNAIDHLTCAIQHGFSYSTVEAPLIIADGLDGRDGVDVRIDGKHCETVRLGSAAVHADAMIVVSHVKGHGEAGFGGALKNVGMGLGTRSAKQRMHSGIKPHVEQDKCTRCGRCVEWCPVDCITIGPDAKDRAFIDSEACIGCGECVAACAYGAIAINWETDETSFQEKMVEHAYGITNCKQGKMVYLSFLTNISPECDCWSFSDAPIVPDIGVLASSDIVAIEQASLDLVTQAVGIEGSRGEGLKEGEEKFHAMHNVNGRIAIDYAESIGMGTTTYLLKTIG